MFPDVARELERTAGFAALPEDVRSQIEGELRANFADWLPEVTEDTMPGELGNCIAGRVANLFNLHGPNFDRRGLRVRARGDGRHDRRPDGARVRRRDHRRGRPQHGVHTFVKFCAIGALSATGTRPYSDGADGFVMGEGAALFVVKRLADAIRDEDRIYAVVRGVGARATARARASPRRTLWASASPSSGPGGNAACRPPSAPSWRVTASTSVGDAVELNSLMEAFSRRSCHPARSRSAP